MRTESSSFSFRAVVARWLLLPLLSLGFFGHANAAYANLAAPAGFSVGGTTGMQLLVNGTTHVVSQGRVAANIITNAGGRAVTVPASMRFAANAAHIAVGAFRLNPAIVVGSAVAAAFMATYGLGWNPVEEIWEKFLPGTSTSFCFASYSGGPLSPPMTTGNCAASLLALAEAVAVRREADNPQQLCNGSLVPRDYFPGAPISSNVIRVNWYNCNGEPLQDGVLGTTEVTNPYADKAPAVDADFNIPPSTEPLPDAIPGLVPVPLPLELPKINPDANGIPQPITIPTGAPVPVPGSVPQKYSQPGVTIIPFNDPANPWRVDIKPEPIVGTDPNGAPDPTTEPVPDPNAPPTTEVEPWCGIPGKPDCTVRVNEIGTPEAPQRDVAQEAIDSVAAEKAIADDPVGMLPPFPELNWAFQMPTACGTIPVAGFGEVIEGIDICQFQDTFHDLMSMVWIIGGLFGAISMFMRNVLATA